MIIAVVVHPDHAEGEHALGLYDPVEQVGLLILGVLIHHGGDGGEDLLHGLNKLGLVAVFPLDGLDDTFDVGIHLDVPPQIFNAERAG